jgi:mannosyltransferase
MAGAIERLLDDAPRLARYSDTARLRMLDAFRIEDEAEAINAVYRRLLPRA